MGKIITMAARKTGTDGSLTPDIPSPSKNDRRRLISLKIRILHLCAFGGRTQIVVKMVVETIAKLSERLDQGGPNSAIFQ
jgi:hypothetical protein